MHLFFLWTGWCPVLTNISNYRIIIIASSYYIFVKPLVSVSKHTHGSSEMHHFSLKKTVLRQVRTLYVESATLGGRRGMPESWVGIAEYSMEDHHPHSCLLDSFSARGHWLYEFKRSCQEHTYAQDPRNENTLFHLVFKSLKTCVIQSYVLFVYYSPSTWRVNIVVNHYFMCEYSSSDFFNYNFEVLSFCGVCDYQEVGN